MSTTFDSVLTNPDIAREEQLRRRSRRERDCECGCEREQEMEEGNFPFIDVFGVGAQTVPSGGNVAFDQGPTTFFDEDDIRFNPPATVVVKRRGTYFANYYILPGEANETFALFVNGMEAPGTRATSHGTAQAIENTSLVRLNCGMNTVQIRNVGPATATITTGTIGNTVNASLTLFKLER